jgi:hypothetical protein
LCLDLRETSAQPRGGAWMSVRLVCDFLSGPAGSVVVPGYPTSDPSSTGGPPTSQPEVAPVSEDTLIEIRDLLAEIRDLLLPVADAHTSDYRKRESVRAALSSESRKKAWMLADGSRTQSELVKESGMDQGNMSKFFKNLREIGAMVDTPNPTRVIEV